jgi:hypothetical protein
VALPGDDQDVADADQLEQLERVIDHRPPADRQQVLVDDAGELAEARRFAARGDESLRLHPSADATRLDASEPAHAGTPTA